MAVAHTGPFSTVGTGRGYDSDPYYRSPVTAPGAVTIGDVLPVSSVVIPMPAAAAPRDRYPPPAEAELVTLWKRSGRVVMSITAGGQTRDFYMPPGRLAYLIKEIAEQLAESTILQ